MEKIKLYNNWEPATEQQHCQAMFLGPAMCPGDLSLLDFIVHDNGGSHTPFNHPDDWCSYDCNWRVKLKSLQVTEVSTQTVQDWDSRRGKTRVKKKKPCHILISYIWAWVPYTRLMAQTSLSLFSSYTTAKYVLCSTGQYGWPKGEEYFWSRRTFSGW